MTINQSILKETYSKVAKQMEQILQAQVPRKTGRLANSIRVEYRLLDKNGSVEFDTFLNGAKYGFYLQTGTGRERDSNPLNKKWDPNPGTGKGGIKPRYWMNFSDTQDAMFMDEILQVQLQAQIEIINKELEDSLQEFEI